MACDCYKSSANGSLMMFGEHAVLHGNWAVVLPINKKITAILKPRADYKIIINSQIGKLTTNINKLSHKKSWQFIIETIKSQKKQIKYGFNLEIKSDFSHKMGLGSSAAVIVSTLKVIYKWLNIKSDNLKTFHAAKKIMLKVQNTGSGADIAASVYGKPIAYRIKPLSIKSLKYNPPIIYVYSGKKVPTTKVIKKVEQLRKKNPKEISAIFSAMNICSKSAIKEINNKNWNKVGELMNIHQGLQDALGVNNKALSEIIYNLRKRKNICGAKISGAGLGDCVIGLRCDK